MIGSLRGTLIDRSPDGAELIVEVQGLGYRVAVSPAASSAAGPVGGESFLHVHHQQREDAQLLLSLIHISEPRDS